MNFSKRDERNVPLLWDLLGRFGLRTSSDAHGSSCEHEPDPHATPVLITGFPRTGTTTAMRRLARQLEYNCCFEPFGRNTTGADDADFSAVHELFRAPPAEMVPVFERSGGFPGALNSIVCPTERHRIGELLRTHLVRIHDQFGMNCVVKCLRAGWNLQPIADWHRQRGIEPVWILLECNPLSPLYTFYRLGSLTENPNIRMPRVQSLYEYRIRLSELVGRHEAVRSLPCRTAAERLVVACMLEHEEQRWFARSAGDRAMVLTLSQVFALGREIAGLCRRKAPPKDAARALPPRYASDALFFDRVVRKLSPRILRAIDEHCGYETKLKRQPGQFSLRRRVTAMRHDLYQVRRAA